MGNCVSTGTGGDSSENILRDKQISKQLRKEGADDSLVQKLLLLGAGESGKSTIFKQMRIMHVCGFDATERTSFGHVVHANVVNSMVVLVGAAVERGLAKGQSGNEPPSPSPKPQNTLPSSTNKASEILLNGFLELQANSFQTALHELTKGLELLKSVPDQSKNNGEETVVLLLARSIAQIAFKHFFDAEKDATQALEISPQNVTAHLLLAVSQSGTQNYKNAISALNRAIQILESCEVAENSQQKRSIFANRTPDSRILASFLTLVTETYTASQVLPEGWDELTDDEGTYFHNPQTLQTTRIRPHNKQLLPPSLEVSSLIAFLPTIPELKVLFAPFAMPPLALISGQEGSTTNSTTPQNSTTNSQQQDSEETKELWMKTIEECQLRMRQNSGVPFLTPLLGSRLAQIWNHRATKHVFANRSYLRLNVLDSISTFMSQIERISSVSFVPSDEDIVLARVQTTGISEMAFAFRGVHFKLIDVGGQRSERRKWLPLFQGVEAVLFIAAINEFDQVLAEDSKTNRLVEAIELFKVICNTPWLANTPLILFLNKRDLFAEKIQRVDLSVQFPDYKGGRSFEAGCRYLMEKFIACSHTPRDIFVHVTCATDRNNVQFVFEAVQDIVVQRNVRNAGF